MVCGNSENRHEIIIAKNDIAKKFGVATGKANWQAQKKWTELVLVAPRYKKPNATTLFDKAIYAIKSIFHVKQ